MAKTTVSTTRSPMSRLARLSQEPSWRWAHDNANSTARSHETLGPILWGEPLRRLDLRCIILGVRQNSNLRGAILDSVIE
jgi:hypothetical protein